MGVWFAQLMALWFGWVCPGSYRSSRQFPLFVLITEGPGESPALLFFSFPPDSARRKLQNAGVSETLVINEIYLSVQGESTRAGLPCVFVRLTACNLRCSYCDTAYAFTEGRELALPEIMARVEALAKPFASRSAAGRLPLVELTGGEPLWQKNSLPLMRALCDAGFTVLLETSGALDIAPVDPRVRRIMDLKAPSSGESGRNRWENLAQLKDTDEIKIVIGTRQDYDWAREILLTRKLAGICPVLFSWVSPLLPHQADKSLRRVPAGQVPMSRRELVEAIIADALPVRFQLQMHKFIWPPDQKGV
jgi:7-carboxy-7-deazaguanine synthase